MMWFVPRATDPAPPLAYAAAGAPIEPEAGDAALVARIAGGDRYALDAAYRREAGAVYRYALALSGNPAAAADATQEAFVALATRAQQFDATRGAIGAWLAGVARHKRLAMWRHEAVVGATFGATVGAAASSSRLAIDLLDEPAGGNAGAAADEHAESPELMLVRAQSSAMVWAAVRALPFVFREALVLVDLQDRPYAEAARIAGIEINTLRTRLYRARHRLAAALNADHLEGVRR